jgi:DNA-binding GntR family transcriptional regulator
MIAMSLDDRSHRINHDSAVTVTAQVAADIEADIDSGALAPDTRLPTETELAGQYGVSRVTVRRAIALLREKGKIVTVHGRGTYVAITGR